MPALLAAWALSSAAASPTTVVAMLPSGTSEELEPLASLLHARASALLEGSSELHARDALAALAEEGPVAPALLLPRLGAQRVVVFRVVLQPDGLGLEASVTRGARTSSTRMTLGRTWSEALERGGPALARLALGRAPRTMAVQPRSTSDEALQLLGRCHRVVLHQPLGVHRPSPLDAVALAGAIEACQAALAFDPTLRFAAATLALAQALAGDDDEAARTLASLGPGDEALDPATLARFWLLTRYQSSEAGAAFLREVLAREPGALSALALLGDALAAAEAHAAAEATWRTYVRRVPGSAWAHARLSREQARLGRPAEALATARRGVALAPGSRVARLELAQRLLDAGQPAAAREQLRPLVEGPGASPRGEDLLTLGAVHLALGRPEVAATAFERALDAASADAEWRTRGRAFYELALLEARRGRRDAARVALRASLRTGLALREVDPLLADEARAIERSDAAGLLDGGKRTAPSPAAPREASLFPLNVYGEPDPKAPRSPAPEGLAFFPTE